MNRPYELTAHGFHNAGEPPPQYKEAEERYRQVKTTPEKILALEEMLAIIPHHKGTDKLIGQMVPREYILKDGDVIELHI
jgi:ribosome-interacting GTPase 1